MQNENYKRFIESRFRIVDKNAREIPFVLNKIQHKYLTEQSTGRDIILKARQQGFSSLILAIFTTDFLMKNNQRNIIVADKSDNASELLDRVKHYIRSYEENKGVKVPLKYNSKYELFNEATNSRYTIGTAENTDFGRSKTITNLHMSECFFYPDFEKILAGALQAVTPDGRAIFETTANGFNYGRQFWYECVNGERPYKPLFYKASEFYEPEFLELKKKELGRMFDQEYPETPESAFLTSGDMYFNPDSLKWYNEHTIEPKKEEIIYV